MSIYIKEPLKTSYLFNIKFTEMQNKPNVMQALNNAAIAEAKEKVKRDTNTVFYDRFEKKSIEDKEKILADLGNIYDKHRTREIAELESRISKLGGNKGKYL
jgi:hypothetical protein